MHDDDAEAARIRTLAGFGAFTLMLGLLIVGLVPDLSTPSGRPGGSPAWFGAVLFALLGLTGLGCAVVRAVRLRRRTRA